MRDDALFVPAGPERWHATDLSRGPWDPGTLHGGPVAALMARAGEAALLAADPDGPMLRPVRLTLDLERPVGLGASLALTSEVVRAGRKVRVAEVALHDDSQTRVARASLVGIRPAAEALDVTGAHQPDDVQPAPPESGTDDATDGWVPPEGRYFHRDAVEHRFVVGSFTGLGPVMDWIRLVVPVVPGEEPSPMQRVAAAADFGNGVSAALPHDGWTFINPDLTVALHRLPTGQFVGLEAATRVDDGGTGTAESALWDANGRIGRSIQTLLVAPR